MATTEKEVPSRIQHKHDTEENWAKAINFIPKVGEFIIYDKDTTHDYQRIKVGDGVTLVNTLPFVSISEETFNDIITNLETTISQKSIQINELQPKFACTWFRPTAEEEYQNPYDNLIISDTQPTTASAWFNVTSEEVIE